VKSPSNFGVPSLRLGRAIRARSRCIVTSILQWEIGATCGHWPTSILEAAITAWVRLSTPSFCRMADTCALTVASETLQLVAICLVEQPFRQHHQHTHLLGRERGEPRQHGGAVVVGLGGEIHIGRGPNSAAEHPLDRLAHLLDASVLGMNPDAPKSMQRRITTGSSWPDTNHHRDARILRPHIHGGRKSRVRRHGKVEQNEIDIVVCGRAGRKCRRMIPPRRFHRVRTAPQPLRATRRGTMDDHRRSRADNVSLRPRLSPAFAGRPFPGL